jgi:chitodextrinase
MTSFRLRGVTRTFGLNPRRRSAPDGGSGSPGDVEAPSVPQNLVATPVSDDQIDLTWSASTDNLGVTGYNIYRDDVLVDTSPTNAYSDTGLAIGTEYEYEVSAFDAAANESARSDPDTATIPDTTAPSVPQNLVATAVSSSQIDLTWDTSIDNVAVTGYNVYRDNVLVDTTPTNSYSDTGLAPGTEHDYEVSAFDAASNESARSTPDSATTHQAIITDGLVAEWRFDDGSGQQITDYSGNGHHAQLGSTAGSDSNDPSWSGGALVFTAANSHYAPVLAGAPVSGSGTWTIHLAIKGGPNSNVVVFSEGSSSSGTQFLSFFKSTSKFRVQYRADNGTIIADVTSAATVYDDAWHFVSVRRAGTTLTIVVDGTSEHFTIGAGTTLTLNRQAFGCLLRTAATNFANGSIAYAICYDTDLSDAQIASVRTVVTALLADRGITLP